MEEGRAEGRAGGQQQGLTKGELIGRIQLCQQLLKTPVAAKDELLAQSPESLQMLADALEQKLGLAKP